MQGAVDGNAAHCSVGRTPLDARPSAEKPGGRNNSELNHDVAMEYNSFVHYAGS